MAIVSTGQFSIIDINDGLSVYTVSIYQQAASQPSTPTGGTYVFSTNTFTPPASWSATPPSATTTPTWVSTYSFAAADRTVTTTATTWSVPTIYSQKGDPGATAKTVKITVDRQIITFDDTGTANPAAQTVTFTAAKQNTTGTVSWTMKDLSGTAVTGQLSATSGDSVTMTVAQFNAARGTTQGVVVTASITDGTTFTDSTTISKNAPGVNSISVALTNPNHQFPAGADGTINDYANSGTTVSVYDGITKLQFVTGTSTTTTGTWCFSATPSIASATDLTYNGSAVSGKDALVSAYSSGTTSNTFTTAYVTFTVSGVSNTGVAFSSLTKIQALTKNKSGSNGPTVSVIANRPQAFTSTDGTLDTAASFTATISTTTMTVSAVTFGVISTGQLVSGSGVTANSSVSNQLYGAVGSAATTATATGSIGATSFTITVANSAIVIGQLISGNGAQITGIPADTRVLGINGTTIYISNALTAALASTTVYFFTAGGTGAYTLSASSTVSSATALTTAQAIVFSAVTSNITSPVYSWALSLDGKTPTKISSTSTATLTAATFGASKQAKIQVSVVSNSNTYTDDTTVGRLETSSAQAGATRNVFRGTWASATAYVVGDIVIDASGYGWSCILANTNNATPVYPLASNTYWTLYTVKGADGQSAQYVVVTGDQAFKFTTGSATPTVTSITLTATLYGGLSGYAWQYWNGTAWTALGGTATNQTYAIAYNATEWGTATSLRTRCLSGTYSDELTIVKLYDGSNGSNGATGAAGANAISGLLTNESATLAADYAGTVADFTPANGTFKVWDGITDKTGNASVAYSVVSNTAGLTIAIASTGVYTITAMSGDTATATLRAVYNTVTIDKIYNIAKSKAGSSVFTAILTNDSQALAADSGGTVSSYTNSGTDIYVYEGSTLLTYDGSGTTAGKWTVSATGTSITPSTPSGSGTSKASYGAHSAMLVANDTASISYAISGKSVGGVSFTVTKIQSFTKSKAGTAGGVGATGAGGSVGATGAGGSAGPTVTVTSNRAAAFTATDGTIDAGQTDLVLTANVTNIASPTYAWTFSGLASNPSVTNASTATITSTNFGTSKLAKATVTVGTYTDDVTIVRLEKSTAAAGATKNQSLSGSVDPTTEGNDGDSYYNSTTKLMWYKSGGTWKKVLPLIDSTNVSTYISGLAVGSAQIADLAVGAAKIADLAVTSAKIDSLAVTSAKIADLAVTSAKIATLNANKIINNTLIKVSSVYAPTGNAVASGTAVYGFQNNASVTKTFTHRDYGANLLFMLTGSFDTGTIAVRRIGVFLDNVNYWNGAYYAPGSYFNSFSAAYDANSRFAIISIIVPSLYVDPATFDPYVYRGSYLVHYGNITATLYLTQASGASRTPTEVSLSFGDIYA